MLTALVYGVKGGSWFSLIDKVYTTGNLESAFDKVKANKGAPGVDQVTVRDSTSDPASQRLEKLRERLRKGEYRPKAVRRVQIPKPGIEGEAPAGDTDGEDRIVQTACATCWSRSSTEGSPSTAMASAQDGAARMRCDESTSCYERATHTWWTPT